MIAEPIHKKEIAPGIPCGQNEVLGIEIGRDDALGQTGVNKAVQRLNSYFRCSVFADVQQVRTEIAFGVDHRLPQNGPAIRGVHVAFKGWDRQTGSTTVLAIGQLVPVVHFLRQDAVRAVGVDAS